MKIVIIGGTGLIGSKLTMALLGRGHDALPASPDSGVNAVTGEGLAQALAGAQVVVDVSNSPSIEDQAALDFFQASGRHLLAAEEAAGVRHHVALSVVGTERLQASGYFRAKRAQEELVKASPIPFTIVHSTQFFEFMGGIVKSSPQGEPIRLSTAFMQPISSDDVVTALVDIVEAPPVGGTVEIAGPDRVRMPEIVQRYLDEIGRASCRERV